MSPLIVRKPPIVFLATRKSSDTKDDANFVDFQTLRKRLRKTLHYGRFPTTDRPSLPMTELAVEFFSKAVPDGLGRIDLDYAASVSRNACISPCSMILAMAYIERVRHRSPEYLLKHVSSSDLFLVSMMVASKFLYDNGEDEDVFNDEWAASAEMEVHEINRLEMDFLRAIDWRVYMDPRTFSRLLRTTEFDLAKRKVRERGWATYTETSTALDAMTKSGDDHDDGNGPWSLSTFRQLILEYVLKVVVVSAMAYVASVMTLVGATLVASHAVRLSTVTLHRHPFDVSTVVSPASTDHVAPETAVTNSSIAPDDCDDAHELNSHPIRNLQEDYRRLDLGALSPSAATTTATTTTATVLPRPPLHLVFPSYVRLPSLHFLTSNRRNTLHPFRLALPVSSNRSSFHFHPKTIFFDVCI